MKGRGRLQRFPKKSVLISSPRWFYDEFSINKSHLSAIDLPLEQQRWGGWSTVLSKDGQGSVIQVSIVMSSGVAPRLCTGQALCQLPCLFCPVLAFWSWGGRIFLEGKQPKPCTTLLLGQRSARQARQDSLSPVFFWMPEKPTAKSSVWAQAPLTMLLREKP